MVTCESHTFVDTIFQYSIYDTFTQVAKCNRTASAPERAKRIKMTSLTGRTPKFYRIALATNSDQQTPSMIQILRRADADRFHDSSIMELVSQQYANQRNPWPWPCAHVSWMWSLGLSTVSFIVMKRDDWCKVFYQIFDLVIHVA